jgi:flagellar hook protein FlgE
LLYQVPVATFTAPDSLNSISGTEFTQTAAAGTLTVDGANNLNDTSFQPGTLESSNVDLGDEFSRMITTQAAYNSATKVFQTADDLLTRVRDLIT